MFLLSSGAAIHGHEYSTRRTSFESPTIRRNRLSASGFSAPIPRRATTYDPYVPSAVHRLPRPLSDHIPQTHEPIVRFQKPEVETMSEDGRSVANSEGSGNTASGENRRRRSMRSSTIYQLAHPAPTLSQKQRLLHIRPKLLFQLQKISAETRPKPVLDVLPSTVVVPRLVKKFPRLFKGKGKLGANDVMVVQSEDYDAPDDHNADENDSDEESLANRDVIAVICQLPKERGGSEGKVEIVLNDGRWVASPLPNNLYEFISEDEHGNRTTARWVRRSNGRRSTDLPDTRVGNDDFKFTFSIVDPNVRRHPIMATLTQAKLDVPDSYSVSMPVSKHAPTYLHRNVPRENAQSPNADTNHERSIHPIDGNLRTLIQVTSVWVALRQEWSPYFKYSDAIPATSINTSVRSRSISRTPDGLRSAGLLNNTPSTPEPSTGGLGSKVRQKCSMGSPTSMASSQADNTGTPQRSVSAGTAYMQRAAARRLGTTIFGTVLSESEEEASFKSPRRAVTETSVGARFSTPTRPLALSGSSATTPETPTRPQRRSQSVYVPTSALQNSFTNGQVTRHSEDLKDAKSGPQVFVIAKRSAKQRTGSHAWNTFINCFRRTNNSSSE